MRKVAKAVFPIVGLGTRFPPVVDKSLIRYAAEKSVATGIEEQCDYRGTRYDSSSNLRYLHANIDLGRRHRVVGAAFSHYLDNLG